MSQLRILYKNISQFKEFCKSHPEFQKCVKATYEDKYKLIWIIQSQLPKIHRLHSDVIFGIGYKLLNNNPRKKYVQDYLVKHYGAATQPIFVYYSGLNKLDSKYCKHINQFINLYAGDGQNEPREYYIGRYGDLNHWYKKVQELPVEAQLEIKGVSTYKNRLGRTQWIQI